MRFYPFIFTGERRLKLTGESNRLDVNADFMTTGTLLNTPTLYPSAYLVLTSKGYTKHYYAGADRVAASLGGGGLKAVGSNPGMQDRADWLFWESHDRVNGRMLQENDHKCIWQGSLPTGEYCKPIDGIPGRMNASVEFYLNDLYYNLNYHSDHLGSASWITDADGKPIQHLQYLPFGEPFVNQHLTDYQERYLFTGKERDEETGYGYFGARYMDHELTAMWLSVDPMADKYPSISPYAYCAWNPIKLIDPDGREAEDDWVKNRKTNQFEWSDKTTSPDNTPRGYKYVGSDNDLLNDLNIRTDYETQRKSRMGVSSDKGDTYSRIGPSGINNSDATIRVSVCTRFDENNISSDNLRGKTFDGINITGYVNQWSRNMANDPEGMTYNGVLVVHGSNDFQCQDGLKKPSVENMYQTGKTPMTATVHVPARNVYGNILQSANINLGHVNAANINGTMKFSWSLLQHPVIY